MYLPDGHNLFALLRAAWREVNIQTWERKVGVVTHALFSYYKV